MKNGNQISLHSWAISSIHVGAYMAIYYTMTKVQIPKLFDEGMIIYFVISLSLSTILIVYGWYVTMNWMGNYVTLHSTTLPRTAGRYILEGIQMFVPGLILLAWESYEVRTQDEHRLHDLEKQQLSNELSYLKAQLNPKFLLNTLDNLKTHIAEKSPKAPEMILRLSDFLDYVLYISQKKLVTLDAEVSAIKNFIELEKLRIGKRLDATMTACGDMIVCFSPLILLSIVQNYLRECALIHQGPLRFFVDIQSDTNEVICTIKLNKATDQKMAMNNIADIRKLLQLSCPDRHEIVLTQSATEVITSLKIFDNR